MAGYALVWKDTPNPYLQGVIDNRNYVHLFYSLGINVASDGRITSTLWDGPAFNAGIVNGAQIVAVGGEAFSPAVIKDAVTAAQDSDAPIELLVKRGERYDTVPVDYHGGLRYPWIEPKAEGEQPFDLLLSPVTD